MNIFKGLHCIFFKFNFRYNLKKNANIDIGKDNQLLLCIRIIKQIEY